METQTYTLPSGATIKIETLPGRGMQDVSASKKSHIDFNTLLEPFGEISNMLFNQISRIQKPESVTVELGAGIDASSNLVLVSGKTNANFKVTVTWKINKE